MNWCTLRRYVNFESIDMLVHTQDWILCWVKIHSFFYLLYPFAVLCTDTQRVSCLWIIMLVPTHDWILCDVWNAFLLLPPFPTSCVVNWCTLRWWVPSEWTFLCILKIRFCVLSQILSFLYLLYPLAVLWTCALIASKFPTSEHNYFTHNCILCWVKIYSFFYLLYPLSVVWTDALLAGKLPLNEHVCKIDFVWWVKIPFASFTHLLLWTGALLAGKLPLNKHICAYSWLDFVPFASLTHLWCCELVHC